MKKHNLFKVIGITILVAVLLTWIFPVTYYSYGQLVEDVRQRAGIFDVLSYATMTISLQTCGNICLFILATAGFYGVIYKIDAYRGLLDKIVKGFKGREYIFMVIIMVLFAVITSMTGLSTGILFLFPFVISILLLMGYDKITAVMTTVGSVLVGLIGSTYSYENTSQLSQLMSVKPDSEIIAKIIILVLGLVLLVFNVLRYAKAHRDTKSISKDNSYIPVENNNSNGINIKVLLLPLLAILLYIALFLLHWIVGLIVIVLTIAGIVTLCVLKKKKVNTKKDSKKTANVVKAKNQKLKIWPLVLIVDLIILVMVLSFISWENTFKLKFFSDITTKFLELKTAKVSIIGITFGKSVADFAVFGSIFGKVSAFGAWDLVHLTSVIVIASGIIGLVYKVKFNDYLDNFVRGAKKAIIPVVLVALIYIVLFIVGNHLFLITILKPVLKLTSSLNVFTMSLVAFVSSVFCVELQWATSFVAQYGITLVKPETYPLVAVIWQAMYGLAMFVAPTSVILFATLSFMHVNYLEWLKAIWKLFVELLIVLLIVFTILIMI